MDKLVAMRNFVKITESTSLSAAARTLAMSLPVVSRGLAELERGLGVRLFTRTTRSLALTDEGETYRQHCLRILADLDNAESGVVASDTRNTQGTRHCQCATPVRALARRAAAAGVSGALPRRVGRPVAQRPRGQSDR